MARSAPLNAEDAQSIVGQQVPLTLKDLLLFCVVTVLAVVYPVVTGHYFSLIWLASPLSRLVLSLRPPTVVAAAGIRRPWRARSLICWSEVEGVRVPALGDRGSELALRGGKTVALQDVPAADAAAVAAVGHKPLLSRIPLRAVRPAPRRPTDQDLAADVQRRAAALAKEWQRMDATNHHRPPSDGR